MADTASPDYAYWTYDGQVFREREAHLLDRWLFGEDKWSIAAGTYALSQEEHNRLMSITPAEAQRRIDLPEPDYS